MLLWAWSSRNIPYSPLDAPSYTGVKAGGGLTGLSNTAKLDTTLRPLIGKIILSGAAGHW